MKQDVEASDFFSTWLMAEAADHDAIRVKKVYIDINEGNLIDGVMFSQIMYWHGINRETGKPRMTIIKDTHRWLAREYSEWYEECRVNYESARASIGRMVKRGLLIKKVYRFNGMATVHIRIDPDAFEKAIKAQNKPSETAINRKPGKSSKDTPVCDTAPIRSGIQSQSGLVSNRKPLTDTTADTTADTKESAQTANAVAQARDLPQPIEPESKRESTDPDAPPVRDGLKLPPPVPPGSPAEPLAKRKKSKDKPNDWSVLTKAMYEAIPDDIRPPRCHYGANNDAAKALWNIGYTPERIAAYVKDMYQADNWFKSGGAGGTPIVINMSMVEKRIKAWEAKKPNGNSNIKNGRYLPDDYGYAVDPSLHQYDHLSDAEFDAVMKDMEAKARK